MKRYRQLLDKKRERYRLAYESYKQGTETIKETRSKLESAEEARLLIQDVAQQLQQEAHHQISAVVTRGLQTVFDEPYQFRIDFEKKRGRTEAKLVFERDGMEHDPINATGGGVVDIAAFTLRVACLALSRPSTRPILVLDEPFKNVSKANGYLDRVPQLLEGLCRDMGIQVVMVTHIEELKVGKVVEITK